MQIPKQGVFDRMGQTFDLFIKNWKIMILPLLGFKIFSYLIFSVILWFVLSHSIDIDQIMANPQQALGSLYTNTGIMVTFLIYLTLGLAFALLIVPFSVATWKIVSQYYDGKTMSAKDAIIYGFQNFFNILKVYWQLFVYVALIPALIFIVSGILLNIQLIYHIHEGLLYIAGLGISIAVIMFIVQMIYRGLRSTFCLISATKNDDFSQSNFNRAIGVTKDNCWRILWNFLLVGFLIGAILGVFNTVSAIADFSINSSISEVVESISQVNGVWESSELSEEDAMLFLKKQTEFSLFSQIIGLMKVFLEVFTGIFAVCFSVIFLKRLELEAEEGSSYISEQTKVDTKGTSSDKVVEL